jgi:phosphatidylinositol kinase/protein kinase (PI-3  family)
MNSNYHSTHTSRSRLLLSNLCTSLSLSLSLSLTSPMVQVRGIEVEECKVMESKKKPLWLTMHNANPAASKVVLMLKVGDDLRQDILILQLLRVMDDIWRKEGLEMQMMLYNCISTGFERGLLQVIIHLCLCLSLCHSLSLVSSNFIMLGGPQCNDSWAYSDGCH